MRNLQRPMLVRRQECMRNNPQQILHQTYVDTVALWHSEICVTCH